MQIFGSNENDREMMGLKKIRKKPLKLHFFFGATFDLGAFQQPTIFIFVVSTIIVFGGKNVERCTVTEFGNRCQLLFLKHVNLPTRTRKMVDYTQLPMRRRKSCCQSVINKPT
jgi:hypothetical protein